MRETNVEAVVSADWHLWPHPPLARVEEKSWYDAMDRTIGEVIDLARKYSCPIIIAGDLFHKPNPPAELVNFLLKRFTHKVFAVPGQHDLINHSYEDIKKTAYWTLVEADKLINLELDQPFPIGSLNLHGFPYGFEVTPLKERHSLTLEVAVIHSYLWIKGKGHKDASRETRLKRWRRRLAGYDVAITGDNHMGFSAHSGLCCVYNCGSLMRRHVDQILYKPSVGLLKSDGTIKRYYLDISQEIFTAYRDPVMPMVEKSLLNLGALLAELKTENQDSVDFMEAVYWWLKTNVTEKITKQLMLESLEKK